jgi:hypothetical protein
VSIIPVRGGTSAPPKNSKSQINTLTAQKLFRNGIGTEVMQANVQFIKHIFKATFES